MIEQVKANVEAELEQKYEEARKEDGHLGQAGAKSSSITKKQSLSIHSGR